MSELGDRVAELEHRCETSERRLAEVRATFRVNIRDGRAKDMDGEQVLRKLLLLLFHEDLTSSGPEDA